MSEQKESRLLALVDELVDAAKRVFTRFWAPKVPGLGTSGSAAAFPPGAAAGGPTAE